MPSDMEAELNRLNQMASHLTTRYKARMTRINKRRRILKRRIERDGTQLQLPFDDISDGG